MRRARVWLIELRFDCRTTIDSFLHTRSPNKLRPRAELLLLDFPMKGETNHSRIVYVPMAYQRTAGNAAYAAPAFHS